MGFNELPQCSEPAPKQAFGLRTEAHRLAKSPALVYLHAEPLAWPGGKAVSAEDRKIHAREARAFADHVAGAEVSFSVCTYKALLSVFRDTGNSNVCAHADMIERAFQP